MSLALALIAHASTRAMRTGTFPNDDPLDARGRSEAVKFLEYWDRPPFARVLSSPMRCAIETAETLGLSATIEPALADMDYGRWRGMRLSDLAEHDPVSLHAWLSDPASAPHGGDTLHELQSRMGRWIDSLTGEGSLIAITHASVIRAALIHALGFDVKAAFELQINPMARFMLVKVRNRRWKLA
ncbi:histidine phosphatase family protein [Paraburkholderia sacchari]|uniref:Histidine phosphatase family protein n=1 Tax=Paraburkholderia sacchari TaxID=159450 RepID=A0A8T6ZNF5_9BURK|nr:histidine phosphatase family protein [Paraburkholderia sacchari]NLP65029.1 histidine phosphatase family protein [Paraburkholderia sacchari]